LFVSSYCIRPFGNPCKYTQNIYRLLALATGKLIRLSALLRRLVPTQPRTNEKKQKQYKTKKTLPLILLTKKKRFAVALDTSSTFVRAGVLRPGVAGGPANEHVVPRTSAPNQ
jgi:hypothetical protein